MKRKALLITGVIGLSTAFQLVAGAAELQDSGKKVEAGTTKIQAGESVQSPEQANKRSATDEKMLSASDEIPGVEIPKEVFEKAEKKGFSIGDLNPIKWVFKPVIDVQKQMVQLQKNIVRLEAPIANLQKPMVGLRTDMVDVKSEMDALRTDMKSIQGQLQVVHSDITDIHGGMKDVNRRLGHIEGQLDVMYKPIASLREPVIALAKPVSGVNEQLTTLKSDLKDLKNVVSLTTTAILIAVVAVGFLICVGTPLVAIFAWRHRRAIMEKFGEDTSGKADPLAETKEDREKIAATKPPTSIRKAS